MASATEQIVNLGMLDGLPDDTKGKIASILEDISEEVSVSDGEALLQEGHLGFSSGYVLLDGAVLVERLDMDSVTVEAPAALGEMSQFLSDDTRTATVRAKGDANLLRFSWDDLYEKAEAGLSEKENRALREAVERLVWTRFDLADVLGVEMLHDLSDDLKVRVCLPFPWIAKRLRLKNGEKLFEVNQRCLGKGFLLTRGEVRISFGDNKEKTVKAPNIIGIMPNNKPERKWTASAAAEGEAEVYQFSWNEYDKRLRERLGKEDIAQFFESMKKNGRRHFWH